MPPSRFSLNQATVKYAPLSELIAACVDNGVQAVGIWRETFAEVEPEKVGRRLADAGLKVSSLCRGGFMSASDPDERAAALAENCSALDEAVAIGAPLLVLVSGGLPDGDRDLAAARQRVFDAI